MWMESSKGQLRWYEKQKTKIKISSCIMCTQKKKDIYTIDICKAWKDGFYLPTLSANSFLNAKLGNEKLHPMIVHSR
jgi:hypothetical protein